VGRDLLFVRDIDFQNMFVALAIFLLLISEAAAATNEG